MKNSRNSILITSIVLIVILIVVGLLFVHHGYEKHFIYHLPNNGNGEISYNSLLNLLDARVNIVNWVVACFGALLTFMAFYVQYQYNNAQKEDLAQERFENKLFHLLDNYREICSQTTLPGVGSGKVVFHYMWFEYKAIYNIIVSSPDIMKEIKDSENLDRLNFIAFTYFLNGISANYFETIDNKEIISPEGDKMIWKALLEKQQASENYNPNAPENNEQGVKYIMDYKHKHIKYFDGHRLRLIPYIKYLTLILDFIKSESRINDIKYLVSEQTDHEIGLIYSYNGFRKYSNKLKNENYDDSKDVLYHKMYESLPSYMARRFKFNSGAFISKT